ncbi:MAG TPA: peptidoglycan-binding protein [Pyrinomonadaceae bacterium]|nr:peptidoglycan-binding protein [Pyrinomonadaceae bacterium]
MLTDDELRQIMPNLPAAKRADYLPFIQQAMAEFDITSYLRETAFIAQLAHESAELRYMEEIASGAAYEGRASLGNTQPGDGKRYKGRGPIQLTGRANYTNYGQLLGLDLVNNPTIAATKEVGFRIAGEFWKLNGLNELADRQDFKQITKRINGGYNGLDDRIKYYERAKKVMSKDDVVTAAFPVESSGGSVSSPASTSTTGIAACPSPYLRQGSRGDAVRSMQQRLIDLGYNVSVDGNFGPGTCAAVKACQVKNGLSDDGVIGPNTWAALWRS